MSTTPAPGSGRETRILLLVILVAVAMLLVLARFRYPGPERTAALPAVGPIERLAARATFEELSLIMADLSSRVQPALAVLSIERVPPPAPPARRGAPPEPPPPSERRMIAALRIDADLAVAYLPPGFRVVDESGVEAVSVDVERGFVLLRVPAVSFPGIGTIAPAIGGPGYVAVFEGARGGPAVRPLFIGRVDSFVDPRWSAPLLSIGGDTHLGPGALIYTLDGRLVGMVTPDDPGVAIVRAPALLAAVEAHRLQ